MKSSRLLAFIALLVLITGCSSITAPISSTPSSVSETEDSKDLRKLKEKNKTEEATTKTSTSINAQDGKGQDDSDYDEWTELEKLDSFAILMHNLKQSYKEADTGFGYYYDENEKELLLILQPPEEICKAYRSSDSGVGEVIKRISDSQIEICKNIINTLPKEYIDTVTILEIDKPLEEDFSLDNCLLMVQNGEEVINAYRDQNKEEVHESNGSALETKKRAPLSSGERNALVKAKDYLLVMPFSASGLKEQLEYEGYSSSEAEYAVDHCGADWYEQARKKAEDYLDIMSFSRTGLIEQLEYDGFTHSQAEYGVNQAY